ncbi:MAG: DHA2 family efflux MFS transporter permease subunit [Candidatus Gastranaerophilales bacterium]|nr:DHA2 family efflux MFS transporter permease subunit [Candidatus Gastranaerophilales bacterium]
MSETAEIQETVWKPSINPWLMIVPAIMAVFMFALDETISNVALTYIAGSFSISQNESIWIVTSYLIASGIIIPTVDFFSKLMGRKNYFILCVIVFTVSSFMCGISQSMGMIVVARFIQGLGGGSILPLVQAIIMESFPPEKRSQSMALFGLTVILAPTLGPIIGGWITENWAWPWIYMINVPIGIVAVIMTHKLLEDPPYARKQKNVHTDYWGLFFLCGWLVLLQIVLDKGNDADWFNAAWICWMTFFSCVFGILFFISQFKGKNPLVNLKILKDRNFLFGTIAQIVMMAVFLASAALLPSMLQALLGYTSFLSGMSMASRGIGSVIAIVIYGAIAKYLGDKFFAVLGIGLIAAGGIFFGMINLQINLQTIAFPNALFGAGMCLGMTTLMTLSFSSLRNEEMTNASGLQNLLKNIGGAFGTSLSTTLISRSAQKHQIMMVGSLSDLNNIYTDRISDMANSFSSFTADMGKTVLMAKTSLYNELIVQAHLWGYIDTFRIFAAACLVIIPLILFIKAPKYGK